MGVFLKLKMISISKVMLRLGLVRLGYKYNEILAFEIVGPYLSKMRKSGSLFSVQNKIVCKLFCQYQDKCKESLSKLA